MQQNALKAAEAVQLVTVVTAEYLTWKPMRNDKMVQYSYEDILDNCHHCCDYETTAILYSCLKL